MLILTTRILTAASVDSSQCSISVVQRPVQFSDHIERLIVHGTGTIIDKCNDGQLVLTCGHLFDSPFERIVIKLSDNRETPGTLVDYDEKNDLAAVWIRNVGIEPVPSDDGDPQVGNIVVASGRANDHLRAVNGTLTQYATAVSRGAVVAVMHGNEEGARHGDSGGPIFRDGKLVGVISGSLGNDTYFSYGQPLRSFIGRVRSRVLTPVTTLPRPYGDHSVMRLSQ